MSTAILLVDQKESTAGIIRTYLKADGYKVSHTPDPQEAVDLASRSRYGLVVTDLVMREMTGIDLYREIRLRDSQTRFLFMLAPSVLSSAAEALMLMGSLERDDVIKKEPLSMNEVICKVRAACPSPSPFDPSSSSVAAGGATNSR
ncbi:response regulator [Nitrososphaera sp.]|uniref:response regulator n=1 Tax=Nitrososphaera sp. TaxID=1971748 RepID=UPI00307F6626